MLVSQSRSPCSSRPRFQLILTLIVGTQSAVSNDQQKLSTAKNGDAHSCNAALEGTRITQFRSSMMKAMTKWYPWLPGPGNDCIMLTEKGAQDWFQENFSDISVSIVQ